LRERLLEIARTFIKTFQILIKAYVEGGRVWENRRQDQENHISVWIKCEDVFSFHLREELPSS
jgi:hypothetical protein